MKYWKCLSSKIQRLIVRCARVFDTSGVRALQAEPRATRVNFAILFFENFPANTPAHGQQSQNVNIRRKFVETFS